MPERRTSPCGAADGCPPPCSPCAGPLRRLAGRGHQRRHRDRSRDDASPNDAAVAGRRGAEHRRLGALATASHVDPAQVCRRSQAAGAAKVLRIAGHARAEAANPFESALRSIALTVPGLHVEPQLVISEQTCGPVPDLVRSEPRIVLEADPSSRTAGEPRCPGRKALQPAEGGGLACCGSPGKTSCSTRTTSAW